jgi:hypothetical protein
VHVSFSSFFSVSHLIPGPIVCVSLIFHVCQVFWPYSRSYNVHFTFLTFSVFLNIFHIL